MSDEVRVVDPVTGGMKGSKSARFSLIPSDFLWALATHYGFGATKYDDNNWRKGYKWSLSKDAMDRHMSQWLDGEDTDAESGTHHLIAVAWHVIALWWFQRHGRGTDNLREPAKLAETATASDGPTLRQVVSVVHDAAQRRQGIPGSPYDVSQGLGALRGLRITRDF